MQRRGWLSIFAVLALFSAPAVRAQNLDEGKSPQQLFAGDCQACHKSPAGLGKNATVGFLRQHYTSSARSASLLAAYLTSAGSGPPPRADRQKAGQGDQKESREERAQRRRERAAALHPPGEAAKTDPKADAKAARKLRRHGKPEPAAAEPVKPPGSTPAAVTATAPSAPAKEPGDGVAAVPAYPPALVLDGPAGRPETPASAAERPAGRDVPAGATVASAPAASPPAPVAASAPPPQPVFELPLP